MRGEGERMCRIERRPKLGGLFWFCGAQSDMIGFVADFLDIAFHKNSAAY